MTQPKDFYQKKYLFLKSLRYQQSMIINLATEQSHYEQHVADNPDTVIYDYMVQQAKLEQTRIDFSLANVERMMHEKEM